MANLTPNRISIKLDANEHVVIHKRRDSLPLLGNSRKSGASANGAIELMVEVGRPKEEDSSLHALPPVKSLEDVDNKKKHRRPHPITTESEQEQADFISSSGKSHSRGKLARAIASAMNNDAWSSVVKSSSNLKRTGSSSRLLNKKSLAVRVDVVTDSGDAELNRHSDRRNAIKPRSVSESSLTRCNLKQGDWVSTQHGPDSDVPWRDMGCGRVVGPSMRKGWLDVEFKSEDRFPIKAGSLIKSKAPVLGFRQRCENPMGSFAVDDNVCFTDSHGCGTVMGPGPNPGTLFVKLEGLGVRSVELKRCVKYDKAAKATPEPEEDAKLSRLSEVTKDVRKRAAWLKMKMAGDEGETFEAIERAQKADGPYIGRSVRAKKMPWKSLGVGIVRDVDYKRCTAMIQIDVKGDLWSLDWDDFDIVKDSDAVAFHTSSKKRFEGL